MSHVKPGKGKPAKPGGKGTGSKPSSHPGC